MAILGYIAVGVLGVILGAYLTTHYGGVGAAASELSGRARESMPEGEKVTAGANAVLSFVKKNLLVIFVIVVLIAVVVYIAQPKVAEPITYDEGTILSLADRCGNAYNVTLTKDIIGLKVVTVGAGVTGQNGKSCALEYSITGEEYPN